MQQLAFIDAFLQGFKTQQPFAFYRLPGEKSLGAVFQKDGSLHPIDAGIEQGFCMAPFELDKANFIIAQDIKKTYDYQTSTPKEGIGFQAISSLDEQAYTSLIGKAQKQITGGEFQKVVLSRQISGGYPQHEIPHVIHRMLLAYPTAFVYACYHPKVGFWMGASPEIFVKQSGSVLETMALAGTRRTTNKTQAWGDKEIQEQAYVEDHIEEQLSTVVPQNSIHKAQRSTVTAGPVQHLCTRFRVDVDQEPLATFIDVLHPTPAVCGFPTDSARTFILTNEPQTRSFYTGYVGLQSAQQTSLFVNLRCASYHQGKLRCYVGGGITLQSNPQAEWEETQQKALTFLKVL